MDSFGVLLKLSSAKMPVFQVTTTQQDFISGFSMCSHFKPFTQHFLVFSVLLHRDNADKNRPCCVGVTLLNMYRSGRASQSKCPKHRIPYETTETPRREISVLHDHRQAKNSCFLADKSLLVLIIQALKLLHHTETWDWCCCFEH